MPLITNNKSYWETACGHRTYTFSTFIKSVKVKRHDVCDVTSFTRALLFTFFFFRISKLRKQNLNDSNDLSCGAPQNLEYY